MMEHAEVVAVRHRFTNRGAWRVGKPVRTETILKHLHATRLTLRDVSEIVVGSCVLGFPVAVTGEVWDLSETLPWSSTTLRVGFPASFAATVVDAIGSPGVPPPDTR